MWVRTPVSVDGYLDDFAQSETSFRDGYFDTGDIGYVTPDKMLVITGRKKEVLNLGGDKVSPRLIEDALTAFDGVHEAMALSVPNDMGIDEVWALIVHQELAERAGAPKALPGKTRSDACSGSFHERCRTSP